MHGDLDSLKRSSELRPNQVKLPKTGFPRNLYLIKQILYPPVSGTLIS